MKLVLFIITVVICIPSIAQVEENKNLEKISNGQVALSETKVSKDAEIITIPGILDDAMTILPKGTEVSVFATANGYWLIKTPEIEGFINEKYLKVTNKMKRVKNDDYAQENSKIDDARIKENKIWTGMNKAQVRENIGEPNSINQYGYLRGMRTELWKYNGKSLYFENGVLAKLIR